MKYDENLSIDPELEARVVAWVLGEASPFEAAELERRVAESPELAIFKRRIESIHGLLGEANKPLRTPLKLSPARRSKLLAAIGVPAKSETGSVMAMKALGSERRWRFPVWLTAVAAALVVGFVIVRSTNRYDVMVNRIAEVEHKSFTLRNPDAPEIRLRKEASEHERRESEKIAATDAKMRSERRDTPSVGLSAEPNATFKMPAVSGAALNPVIGGKLGLNGSISANTDGAGSMYIKDAASITFKSQRFGGEAVTGGANGRGAVTLSAPANVVASGGSVSAPTDNYYVDNDENLVKLSPFEVQAPAEQGYQASSALAGSRLNTNLKDIGLSVSTFSGHSFAGTHEAPNKKHHSFGYVDAKSTPQQSGASAADGVTEDSTSFLAFQPQGVAEADKPITHPPPPPNLDVRTETKAMQHSVSTFSLHVGDAAFRLAQAALARGERPDPSSIRPEEFYNAFDYGDPAPAAGEPVACRIEQAAHPLLQQRNLLRIAMRVPAAGRAATQALRLTLLLDTSGSMEREDRTASVRRAMEVLASLLGPQDRITVIGFARQPRLLAEQMPGNEANKLVDIIARTPAEGGTNLEEALKLAGDKARGQFDANAQNRIVVLSDGAANLGSDDPTQLSNLVAALRQQGISFDACGVGVRGLDDSILEALTRKGDGRYYVINSAEDADAGFARKLAGALRPAAENVKVQVRFNPARVQSYRLIGFEQHRLREEDFRNDKVTAAELAGGEGAVALYEVQVNPAGEGELGEVFVRFRETATGAMVERSWTALYEPRAPSFGRAPPSLQLAGTAALLAEKLQGGDAAKQIRLSELAPIVNQIRGYYAHDRRVQDFVSMFGQARRLFDE